MYVGISSHHEFHHSVYKLSVQNKLFVVTQVINRESPTLMHHDNALVVSLSVIGSCLLGVSFTDSSIQNHPQSTNINIYPRIALHSQQLEPMGGTKWHIKLWVVPHMALGYGAPLLQGHPSPGQAQVRAVWRCHRGGSFWGSCAAGAR